MARRWIEGGDQPIDMIGANARHVAKTDHGAVDIRVKQRETRAKRCAQAIGEIGVMNKSHVAAGKRFFKKCRFMAGDHNHR